MYTTDHSTACREPEELNVQEFGAILAEEVREACEWDKDVIVLVASH